MLHEIRPFILRQAENLNSDDWIQTVEIPVERTVCLYCTVCIYIIKLLQLFYCMIYFT